MEIIFLIYGLAFLVMGLVILIRYEHQSDLELGNILWLLALFAFLHGILEWTDLWKIVRGTNPFLNFIQPFLLLISYLFLLEFGRRFILIAIPGSSDNKILSLLFHYLTYIPLAGMIAATVFVTDSFLLNLSVAARYFTGFPGALLTGFAFRYYWLNVIKNEMRFSNNRFIQLGFQTAGISFFFYSILGGLIVSKTEWFPASLVNQDEFYQFIQVPVQLFRAVSAVSATIAIGFILKIYQYENIFRLKQNIESKEQALSELRKMNRMNEMILCSAAEGIFGIDLEGKTIFINNAALQILKLTKEEISGKPIHSIIHKFKKDGSECREEECIIFITKKNHAIHNVPEDVFYRSDSSSFPVSYTSAPIWDDATLIGVVVAFQDITERLKAEDDLKYLAYYDSLTHLPNRRLLGDRIHHALASSARNQKMGSLLFIDIDNFKKLNDSLGHSLGDELLLAVAQRLNVSVREGDSVSRFGNDEFVVMLEDLSESKEESAGQARIVAEKILSVLNEPYQLSSCTHHCTSSIGITLFSGTNETPDELLKQADLAMHQAKDTGKNSICFFDRNMQVHINERISLESDLHRSLSNRDFKILYQPQVDHKGKIVGVEALIRWEDRVRGLVSPNDFIPLAEDTGLIIPIGAYVLEETCRQQVIWSQNPELSHVTISVNVSLKQFTHKDFSSNFLDIIRKTGADPEKIKLEITESIFMENYENVIEKMSFLREHGIGFSLDDFGTGYSSLSHMKHLPLDQIKIDKSFVKDILTDSNDDAIIRAIITLAETMNLSVIAEGVENFSQKEFLQNAGCRLYQGYFFGYPVTPEKIEQFMS
ncbi:MAG: EAL domain-containing protein [Spirochaetia bacterium]|nr:EAL domain-containing protein [Spirochaetia bacterium]